MACKRRQDHRLCPDPHAWRLIHPRDLAEWRILLMDCGGTGTRAEHPGSGCAYPSTDQSSQRIPTTPRTQRPDLWKVLGKVLQGAVGAFKPLQVSQDAGGRPTHRLAGRNQPGHRSSPTGDEHLLSGSRHPGTEGRKLGLRLEQSNGLHAGNKPTDQIGVKPLGHGDRSSVTWGQVFPGPQGQVSCPCGV